MMEEPGSFSGKINSPYPALGPEPRNLISFEIFINATAQVLKIIETSFEETSRRLAVSRNIFVEMLATMDPEKRELLAKALQN